MNQTFLILTQEPVHLVVWNYHDSNYHCPRTQAQDILQCVLAIIQQHTNSTVLLNNSAKLCPKIGSYKDYGENLN